LRRSRSRHPIISAGAATRLCPSRQAARLFMQRGYRKRNIPTDADFGARISLTIHDNHAEFMEHSGGMPNRKHLGERFFAMFNSQTGTRTGLPVRDDALQHRSSRKMI